MARHWGSKYTFQLPFVFLLHRNYYSCSKTRVALVKMCIDKHLSYLFPKAYVYSTYQMSYRDAQIRVEHVYTHMSISRIRFILVLLHLIRGLGRKIKPGWTDLEMGT